jgi:hypothetical protein
MMDEAMNRRKFLLGLVATGVATACVPGLREAVPHGGEAGGSMKVAGHGLTVGQPVSLRVLGTDHMGRMIEEWVLVPMSDMNKPLQGVYMGDGEVQTDFSQTFQVEAVSGDELEMIGRIEAETDDAEPVLRIVAREIT